MTEYIELSTTERLQAVYNIELALGGGRELEHGFAGVLEQLMEQFQADGLGILLWQSHWLEDLEVPATYGSRSVLLPDNHMLIQAVRQQENATLISPDKAKSSPVPDRSIILAPIMGSRKSLGALQLIAPNGRVWSEADVLTMQIIGRQIGIALQNAQLFIQMRLQENELAWVNKMGDSLLHLFTTLQIDEVVERIMHATKDLLGAEESSIILRDYESQDLILWRYTPPERDLSFRLKPGQGVAGWVYANGKTAIVNEAQKDPRWESKIDDGGFVTRSLLATPIFLDNDIIGVLEAVNKKSGHFGASDEGLVQMLAKWAAIAIGNANRYDSLKRTTEQLADAKKQTAMAHMVLNLAHKINNSVGAIRVWAMEARDEVVESSLYPDEMQTFIDNIMENAEETLNLVRRIRSATEINAGDIRPVSVEEMLEAAVRVSRLSDSVTIERNYEESLPPIGADAERLVEVFLNIINNAVDAIEPYGKITFTTRRTENKKIEVLIQDNGSGIPEHLRSRLFDPFVTNKQHGLGLGLWMAKLYVELINGSISMSTATGGGTTFRITLPAYEDRKLAGSGQ